MIAVRVVLILGALLTQAAAQLQDWSALPSTQPVRTFAEAHIAVVQEAGDIAAFSTYTRAWTHLAVSANATFYGYDDHICVVDGNQVHAYASRFGEFVPIAVSGTPTVPTSPASSYLTVVLDGANVHVFSPFLGTWTSLVCQNTPFVGLSKVTAVIGDGAMAYGYSPFFGNFVPLPAPLGGPASVDARCYCGYATDGVTRYGFSSEQNQWTAIPAQPSAVLSSSLARSGYLAFLDGPVVTFYSGITGTCVQAVCSTTPVFRQGEQVGVLQDGQLSYLYSSIHGTVTPFGAVSVPVLTIGNYFAVLQDGPTLHTFSAVTGTFAQPVAGSWSITASINAALAVGAGSATLGYSPLRNEWVPGPVATSALPTVTQGSVILLDAANQQLHGFSTRTGTWSTVAASGVDSSFTFGSNFVARAGNQLFAFNERYGRWSLAQTTAPATIRLHQQAILAQSGTELLAYSTWNDRWSRSSCASAPIAQSVADDVAMVRDAAGVYVYGGSCQVTTQALYPEWWRFVTRGTTIGFHLAGESGAPAVLGLSFTEASMAVPGIGGLLGLDPAGVSMQFLQLPQAGTLRRPLVIPNASYLAGLTLFAQAVVVGPNGPYFTGTYPTTIL